MKAIEFVGQNVMLSPPQDWDNARPGGVRCGDLPVMRAVTGGEISMSSFWRPDAADLAVLNAGGHVRLDIFCPGHPPVWVSVEKVQELP